MKKHRMIDNLGDDTLIEYSGGRLISSESYIGDGTIVQAHVVIERDCVIGDNCRIGYGAKLRRGTVIGDNSVFGTLSVCEGNSEIGEHTTIHSQCHITEGVKIGDWVFIAPFFCGANTPNIVHGRDFPLVKKSYSIEFGARIGICVDVAPGLTIGRESFIWMGSLIVKDVEPFSIMSGRPATKRGIVSDEERLKFEPRRVV